MSLILRVIQEDKRGQKVDRVWWPTPVVLVPRDRDRGPDQENSLPHIKSEAIVGCMRPYLKNKQQTKNSAITKKTSQKFH